MTEIERLQSCKIMSNSHLREAKINFIVSGSIQTLMKRIFEDESEPLYGRPTSKFTLRPFTIEVMKEILHDANPNYSPEDLLCLYAITSCVFGFASSTLTSR